MKVLVTGAGGQLGVVTVARWRAGHEVTACGRQDLDVTDHKVVMARVAELRPALILNCAAYNKVDEAEVDPLPALRANAFAVRSLARAAVEYDAVLVHYGSDFVFSGEAASPYTEADEPAPQGVYAASKLLGDWFALQSPRSYVLRVESLFGGPAARSSVDKIVDALLAGRRAPVFVDRIVSPSYVEDVAEATSVLVERQAPFGLYHCVNDGHASWHDVGREIARLLGADESLLDPVSTADVPMRAKRPRFCALSNAKLRQAGAAMATWQSALARYVDARRAPETRRGAGTP